MTLDTAALDLQLTAIIQAIRFPADRAIATAIQPVLPCLSPMMFSTAKQVHQNQTESMTEALLGRAMLAALANDVKPAPLQAPLCLDASSTASFGVYRELASNESYIIALADGGVSISVEPSLAGQLGTSRIKRYSVTQHDLARDMVFAPYNHLPAPEVVVQMTGKARPISVPERGSSTTNITIGQ